MGEVADYFKRESYITKRLSLLVLGGTVVLLPVGFEVGRGHWPTLAMPCAVAGVVLYVAVGVIFILHRANLRFPRPVAFDEITLDDGTSRKLRRRILLLKTFAAVYAAILVSIVVHMHRGEWPGVVGAAAVIAIMEVALVKAIRRLTVKLKAGTILMRNTMAR